jgi:hypothetical protein
MPDWNLPHDLDASANAFREKFGSLTADEWCELQVASMTWSVIGGVEFPHFAPREMQERIHGTSGEAALREAASFYKFVSSRAFYRKKAVPGANFLDFGTGWGRISRYFLRDFDLNGLFAFEPRRTICYLARSLNPYVCVLSSEEIPNQTLPANWFDVVVGWSVFSHLSEFSTTAWLTELARIIRPDGYCVLTTFGERFFDHLAVAQANMRAGKEIHWYFRNCLDAAGDLEEQRQRYLRGEFVWLPDDPNKPYGHATILHEKALQEIVRARRLPFELVEFDHETLNMDVFVLRRR